MKWNRIAPLLAVCAIHAQADSLNVVHLGPDKELGFETKAGGVQQEFTLPRLGATGGFLLPPKKAAELATRGEGAVSVKLQPSEEPRIAVLHPEGESFVWRICTSKPTEGKFTLRLINLSKEKATVTINDEALAIPADGEMQAPTPQRTFALENGETVTAPPSDEPGAVVAFLYKLDGKWQVHFFQDT